MQLPADLLVMHQPVRLRIMSTLHRQRRVRFAALRDGLGLTDGNLATHVRRLEESGWVRTERGWSSGGFQTFVQLTPVGSDAIVRYASAMRAFLADISNWPEPRRMP